MQTTPGTSPILSQRMLWLTALACGVSVANICYSQPLLGDYAAYFHATPAQVGWVVTAGQAGYGLGLLFFLPLGDIVDRNKLVLTLTWLGAAFLALAAVVPTLGLLILASLLVGAVSMSAQILIPFAVDLSPPERRSQTIGVLMTGLLGGVLLARTLSGFVGDYFGWRSMFGLAAAMMVMLALLLRGRLPHRKPAAQMSYGRLMTSLWEVLRSQPRLYRPALIAALSYGTFMAFWTTLPFIMTEQFHRGAPEAGLFGLVGLAGALAAPYAGRLADKRGSRFTVTAALVLTVASFGLMAFGPTMIILVVGVLLMDVGVQTVQVSEQGNVLALLPEARSRLNTLYMVARFAGGAVGSLAGAYAWSYGRWSAVSAVAVGFNVLALAIHWIAHSRRKEVIVETSEEFSAAA